MDFIDNFYVLHDLDDSSNDALFTVLLIGMNYGDIRHTCRLHVLLPSSYGMIYNDIDLSTPEKRNKRCQAMMGEVYTLRKGKGKPC